MIKFFIYLFFLILQVNNATARQTPLPSSNPSLNSSNLSTLLLKSNQATGVLRKDNKLVAAISAQAAMATSLARIYSPADLATINALRAVNIPAQNQLLLRAQNGGLIHHPGLTQHQLLNPSLAQAINLNLQQQQQTRYIRPILQQQQQQHQQQQQQQQSVINLQNSLVNMSNSNNGTGISQTNSAAASQILTNSQQQQQQLTSQNNALLVAALQQQQQQNRMNSASLPPAYA